MLLECQKRAQAKWKAKTQQTMSRLTIYVPKESAAHFRTLAKSTRDASKAPNPFLPQS